MFKIAILDMSLESNEIGLQLNFPVINEFRLLSSAAYVLSIHPISIFDVFRGHMKDEVMVKQRV